MPLAVEVLEEAGPDPTVAIDEKGAGKGHSDQAGIRVHKGHIFVDVRGSQLAPTAVLAMPATDARQGRRSTPV
jgi:hypothetical protein